MKYKSIFDIIGPIMVGPSSSHTAGAARIGRTARNLFRAEPTWVKIHYYESFAQTHNGHGTDLALIGGILGMDSDDDNLVNSMEIAEEKGIDIQIFEETETSKHPNAAKIRLGNGEKECELLGVSIGGGMIEVIEINGFALNMKSEVSTIIIRNLDRFGVIANVTNVLVKHEINIGCMDVARKEKGQESLMTIEVDQEIPDCVIDELSDLENILEVIEFNE